ncbi:MAG TPA: FHA domain-containing protein [Candidatus Baltobacteraceae bacterium]
MNVFAAVEAWCSDTVERAFALAFPLSLEPVQVARKLATTFESTAVPSGSVIGRIVVRTSRYDAPRLQADAALQPQWTQMLARLAARAGRTDRPAIVLESADDLPRGTVALAVDVVQCEVQGESAATLALRVRRGVPLDALFVVNRPLIVGRDLACDIALVDARVSRRHLELNPGDAGVRFRDLDSANGVLLNGRPVALGVLRDGDTLRLGDSELVCESAPP